MNSEKPLIGIMGNLLPIENGPFLGSERIYVTETYCASITRAGGVAVIIPPVSDIEGLERIVTQMDGILLSGGYDVDPFLYGEEPKTKLGFVHRQVDEATIEVIRLADKLNKPIFGICKGAQILNVAFGGTIHQDISYIEGSYIKHDQSAPNYRGTHKVVVEEGSRLHRIIGESLLVNSYHHQAVDAVAEGFIVSAIASDGVIEAIEKKGDNFVVAVQWHPEMMSGTDTVAQKLFDVFVKEAAK